MKIKILVLAMVLLVIPFAKAYTQDDVYTKDLDGDGFMEYKAELQYNIDNYRGTGTQLLKELNRVCVNKATNPEAPYANSTLIGDYYSMSGSGYFWCIEQNPYIPNIGHIEWEGYYDSNPLDMEISYLWEYGWKFNYWYGAMFPVLKDPVYSKPPIRFERSI